jgi:hypothetical protein
MNTREACETLRMQHKGWNVDGPKGVLRHLDAAQNMLMACAANANVVTAAHGADFPTLTTRAGHLSPYNAPAEFRTVEHVLVKAGRPGALASIRSNYDGSPSALMTLRRINWFGHTYVVFPYVRIDPRRGRTPPSITFSVFPGETTGTYHLFGYRAATPLTSVSSDLTMEPPWDEEYLLPAASALIEGINHGNYIEARKNISELRKMYQRESNKSAGFSGAHIEPVFRGF